MSRGIDYSGPGGTCNRDKVSGIRFGIISVHTVTQWFYESLETHYSQHCPSCGNELSDDWEEEGLNKFETDEETAWNGKGLPCPDCYHDILEGEEYGDEPDSKTFDEDGSSGFLDNDGDIWVTKSDFYTKAQFASPCAPGAGHLEQPCDDGVKTFCLNHCWYEDGIAPYPVYRVSDDSLVEPEAKE